jgi:hypothetical protein
MRFLPSGNAIRVLTPRIRITDTLARTIDDTELICKSDITQGRVMIPVS